MRTASWASANPVWTKTCQIGCIALVAYFASWGSVPAPLVRAETTAETAEPKPRFPAEVSRQLAALEQWVRKKGGRLSAHLIDMQSGAELGSGERLALNPASNMKVLTAAYALEQLGASHSFHTGLYGDIRDGVAQLLVLRGNGDPSLTEAALWRLANSLANRGLRRVDRLLVDQSRFDGEFIPPAFEQQPDEWAAFRAPISAIALERNSVVLNVLPTRAGQPARVWFEPNGAVQVQGRIETVASGRGQNVQLQLQGDPSGTLIGRVGGRIAAGLGRQRYPKRMDDPRLVPGLVLAELLRQRDIEVAEVALGGQEAQNRLTYHGSAPLTELLPQLGKYSDNFYAEMLFKAFSQRDSEAPASSQRSAELVMQWLRQLGAADEETRVINGSGLFDANRLSALTLTRVLRHAYHHPKTRAEMVSHLAIGGVDGTLRSRFSKLASTGQVRAKTGTLRDSITLSGYFLRDNGQAPIAFSLLVNGIEGQHGNVRARLDRVVESLAQLG